MFSDKEFNYLSDQDFLITKRVITDKVITLFSELEGELKQLVNSQDFSFPSGTLSKSGKISKGENYRGLPYVILDYPRLLKKDNIFAYRTIFWWGNFFTNTFQTSINHSKFIKPNTLRSDYELYLQTQGDLWDHSLQSATLVKEINLQKHLSDADFLKISQKIPLKKIDDLKRGSIQFLNQIMS